MENRIQFGKEITLSELRPLLENVLMDSEMRKRVVLMLWGGP